LFLGLLATTVLSPSRCNRGFAEIFAEKIRRSQKAGELPTNGKHYMGILYKSHISGSQDQVPHKDQLGHHQISRGKQRQADLYVV